MNTTPQRFRYFSPWLLAFSTLWLLLYLWLMPQPAETFLEHWPLILIGIAGATIGNLTAIGGGIIFLPFMMFVYKLDPVSSLKLAVISQSVGMTSGASGWLQRKEIPIKLLKWTVPSLLLGTAISTFLFHPSPLLVKSLFGPVSFLAGVLTLLMLNRKSVIEELPSSAYWPLFIVSIIGGTITGWVAIGEGEIIASFCMLAYGLSANKSVGLGVVLLSVNSIVLALLYTFYFGGVPWEMAAFTMMGALWGGRLGPYVAQNFPTYTIKKIFGWVALLDGALIIFQVIRNYSSN